MKIKLIRFRKGKSSVIGRMYLDGQWQCYTLEDSVRSMKLADKTAVPSGTYQLVIDHSLRFGRLMPHLLNVPGFEGIRIHAGNTDKDTQGCVLVGRGIYNNCLTESRLAFDDLFKKLQASTTPITIEIINSFK